MTSLRTRILGREPVFGTFCAIPHPMAVEICAVCGLDMICIDWEHSQIGRGEIEGLIRAADVNDTPAFVRLPQLAVEHFSAALDAGAAGVLVPRVETAEQAREAVKAMRFPPLGSRGVGPGRASGYGARIDGYIAEANERLCLAIQIESHLAVENIDRIAAVDGVDMIFVGPGDLRVSLDALGRDGPDDLEKAIRRIVDAALSAGKSVGMYLPSHADTLVWSRQGISTFILGSDAASLAAALAGCVQEIAAAPQRAGTHPVASPGSMKSR